MTDLNEPFFCPKCKMLLLYKENFEKVELWLECKCGYKERARNPVVCFKEFPDYEKEKEEIPVTKGVHCPYCGHGEAGFFEEWIENVPGPGAGSSYTTEPIEQSEETFYSGSHSDIDVEDVIAPWAKDMVHAEAVSEETSSKSSTFTTEFGSEGKEISSESTNVQRGIQKKEMKPKARRALFFICLNSLCSKTWEAE